MSGLDLIKPSVGLEEKRYLPAAAKQDKVVDDWRKFKYGSGHSQRFKYILDSGLFTDVTFAVGTNKQEFKAHKLILRTGSQVFDDLFKENCTKEFFEVIDVEPEEFDYLLKFLYTGDCADIEWLHVPKFDRKLIFEKCSAAALLKNAFDYQIPNLVEICAQILTTDLKAETALDMYRFALKHNAKCLKEGALDFICKSTSMSKLIKSDEFLHLTIPELCGILERDDLQVRSEETLFEAVIKWGNNECKRRNIEITDKSSLRPVVAKLIPLIRFTRMDPTYFALKVVPSQILLTEEFIPLFQHNSVDESNRASISLGAFNTKSRVDYKPCGQVFVLKRLVSNSAGNVKDPSLKGFSFPLCLDTSAKESIRMRSSLSIWLSSIGIGIVKGYNCFTSSSGEITLVKIRVEDDQCCVLAEKSLHITAFLTLSDVFHLKLDQPLYLQTNKWYELAFTVTSGKCNAENYIALDGIGTSLNFKPADGSEDIVTFEFQNSENSKYTSVTQGLIPEIGFMVE